MGRASTPALMIQGCGSDVGKSVLVAGLCRLFTNRGLRVRPFKSQNMSNNAAVTAGGGEIGRAQALQALACRTEPTVDMNPVLLKPQSDVGSQLIIRGQMSGTLDAGSFRRDKSALLGVAVESYQRLAGEAQLMIVEGAGSPAETNLRQSDIANMGLAHALGLPVVLVGDINRGHVIASLVGAHAVLDAADRAMIRGFVVNKFRGNVQLFDDGVRKIADSTGWPSLGVVPWLRAAARLPSEDGVQLEQIRRSQTSRPGVRVVVPQLSRIANFDDFDPLREEPGVELMFVPPGRPLPRDATLIIIPGTKSTIADMEFMRSQGWDIDVLAHVRHGGRVLGICGGYQMLGASISDPDGIEGPPRTVPGLGLLDVQTVMTGDKTLREVMGELIGLPGVVSRTAGGSFGDTGAASGVAGGLFGDAGVASGGSGASQLGAGGPVLGTGGPVLGAVGGPVLGAGGDPVLGAGGGPVLGQGDPVLGAGGGPAREGISPVRGSTFVGYEMHVGVTSGRGTARPFLLFADGTSDGAVSSDGRVAGCYVHGLFGATSARAALVASLGAVPSYDEHSGRVDAALDEIAAVLEGCLDIDKLSAIAGL